MLVLVACSGRAQNIQLPTDTDMPGLLLLGQDKYEGEGLNEYLSGAADLYLEYGFSRLLIENYMFVKDKATLEVYKMGDAASAFGIYSLSVSKCRNWNQFGNFSCSTPKGVAACSGNLFIYASNTTGTASAQGLCEQLVKSVVDKNPQEQWYAPPLAQSARAAPFTHTLRYFKGLLGIRKGLPYWAGIFENLPFEMYTINISDHNTNAVLARIIFPDQSALSSFISRAGLNVMSPGGTPGMTGNGLYRSWYKINNATIVFLESNSPTLNIKDFVPAATEIK